MPRKRNESVEMGFYDNQGRFHPIRASDDYDREAAGEFSRARKKKGKKKGKKNPSSRSRRLTNFTGTITRLANGAVLITGMQRKK